MKHTSILLLAAITSISLSCNKTFNDSEHILSYEQPASVWQEMLPVGNGRMGMMLDGNPLEEQIIINEISLWSGSEVDYANPDAAESLPAIRQALIEGRNARAQEIMYERFVPKKETDGGTYGTYQVLGQLIMRHDYAGKAEPEHYRRWIDLREATSYTDYSIDGIRYRKKYYVSRTDDVMVVEVSASKPESIDVEIELDRAGRAAEELTSEGLLKFSGTLDSGTEAPGMSYCAYTKVMTDGEVTYPQGGDPCIRVSSADKVWIIISAATDYFSKDYESMALSRLESMSPRKMRIAHKEAVKAHQELYLRNTLSLSCGTTREIKATDKRI